MADCPHNKIQVIRKGRSYVWSCALCGDEMVRWDGKVWETLQLDELQEGEGFIFNVVKKEDDKIYAPKWTWEG